MRDAVRAVGELPARSGGAGRRGRRSPVGGERRDDRGDGAADPGRVDCGTSCDLLASLAPVLVARAASAGAQRVQARRRDAPAATCSAMKRSSRSCSAASATTSSARRGGMTTHAVVVADDDVARADQRAAAGDRHVEVPRDVAAAEHRRVRPPR